MLLSADIGGTHARFILFNQQKKIHSRQTFLTKDYRNFSQCLNAFINGQKIEAASIAVAGPVKENRCRATNLPWIVDGEELKKALNTPHVYVLNDLEANAFGIRSLKKEEFFLLNKGISAKGNEAMISPGTGLGEAGLFFSGSDWMPFACEGGHADFAPRSPLEVDLLYFMKNLYGHVSYERILSGPGIIDLYLFLGGGKEFIEEGRSSEWISEQAINEADPICVKTLEMFISILGAEAGNLALKMYAVHGIYLGGGILPKILPLLKKETFFEAFTDKGRFSAFLEEIPVKVVLNDQTALLGSLEYLLKKI